MIKVHGNLNAHLDMKTDPTRPIRTYAYLSLLVNPILLYAK